MTSLEGLQIINFKDKLINVDENVGNLLSHMHQNPIHISYMPTYLLTGDTKITDLNTVSLHKYFDDVHTNHNIVSSDVTILSETRLTNYDINQDYKLPLFKEHLEMTNIGMGIHIMVWHSISLNK